MKYAPKDSPVAVSRCIEYVESNVADGLGII